MKNVYAVILVGGKGKRLRPLSTAVRPKAFLSITKDNKTMFRKTIERIARVIPASNIMVIANKHHAMLVKEDFPKISARNLILEPVSRNTAPAITLAASIIHKIAGDRVIAVLPTDQYIVDEARYVNSLKESINFASKKPGAIVTLGLKPRFPSVDFGYIKIKKEPDFKNGVRKVEKFTEKPSLETAKGYLKSGCYLWNMGTFIFRANSILKAIKKFKPRILESLQDYKKVPNISIDYAVMEKADNIFCVEGDYDWKDMGSFESLKEILGIESRSFISKNGKIIKIL